MIQYGIPFTYHDAFEHEKNKNISLGEGKINKIQLNVQTYNGDLRNLLNRKEVHSLSRNNLEDNAFLTNNRTNLVSNCDDTHGNNNIPQEERTDSYDDLRKKRSNKSNLNSTFRNSYTVNSKSEKVLNNGLAQLKTSLAHVYELRPEEINKKFIREIIGVDKVEEIPHCSKLKYETEEKWDYLSKLDSPEHINKLRDISVQAKDKRSPNPDLAKRSKWRLSGVKGRINDEHSYHFKKKSPLEYLHISKSEVLNIGHEQSLADRNSNLKNPEFKISQPIAIQEEKVLRDEGQIKAKLIKIENKPLSNMKNILATTGDNNGEIHKRRRSSSEQQNSQQNVISSSEKSFDGLNNVLVSSVSSSPPKILLFKDNNIPNQKMQIASNFPFRIVYNGLTKQVPQATHTEKFSLKNILHKNVKSKSSDKAETITYIYFQPIPLLNPFFIERDANLTDSKNQSKPQGGNDTITISIDPKTLQNKILHAEFFKKSIDKKEPDTLSIQLLPLNSTTVYTINTTVQAVTTQKINTDSVTNYTVKSAQTNYISNNSQNVTGNSQLTTNKQITSSPNTPTVGYSNSSVNTNKVSMAKAKLMSMGSKQFKRGLTNLKQKHSPRKITVLSPQTGIVQTDGFDHEGFSNGPTKVIVIQTKQNKPWTKEDVCPSELGCNPTPKPIDCPETICLKTTQNLKKFKELHESIKGNKRELEYNDVEISDLYTENPKWMKECSSLQGDPPYKCFNMTLKNDCNINNDKKRETREVHEPFVDSNILPIIIVNPKSDEKCKHSIQFESTLNEERDDLRADTFLGHEKANKKVENKILEGFINSIIANYSKDPNRASTKEPPELNYKSDENELSLKEFTNMKQVADSDSWSLSPMIVPESNIMFFRGKGDYAELGPFDEDLIKSMLQKESVQLVQKKEIAK